ncbi:MAG TPA: glycosyltransferase family 39 protein [Streptosporangiaceae bacterium]|nr:glycosyltransferase family 39 protein [Streptosporangiaceae bacterium]
MRQSLTAEQPFPGYQDRPASHRRRAAGHRRELAVAGAILAAAAALRLWDLAGKPGWQSDEPVYTSIATNVATLGTLNEHLQYGLPWTPFLFHPPFYFLLLAGWFKLAGAGVPQARLLGVLMALGMFVLLFRLLWKLHGSRIALMTLAFLAFDGWLLFIQRVSYIENTLFVLVVGAMLLYQRALERPTRLRFLIAGAAVGCAIVFKQTGTYLLPTVGLHWLITRREHRNHLVLTGTALLVVALYFGMMTPLFDVGSHHWFLDDTLLQLERVVNLRHSGGTLTSPFAFLDLLTHQYAVFLPSFLAAVAGFVLVVRRTVQCARTRSVAPLRRNTLLFSWTAAAIVVFGASELRYQQYFALLLVPLYCFLWTELAHIVASWQSVLARRQSLYKGQSRYSRPRLARAVAAGAVAVVLAGLGSFYLRVVSRSDDVLAQVRQYAMTHIPRSDVVVAPEQIGDELNQRWCSVYRAPVCRYAATYVITYVTFLQGNPPDDPVLYALLRNSVKLVTFQGFKETVTVWRVR